MQFKFTQGMSQEALKKTMNDVLNYCGLIFSRNQGKKQVIIEVDEVEK